jgi:hypothetical protein
MTVNFNLTTSRLKSKEKAKKKKKKNKILILSIVMRRKKMRPSFREKSVLLCVKLRRKYRQMSRKNH